MKITKTKLQQIIKEEIQKALKESDVGALVGQQNVDPDEAAVMADIKVMLSRLDPGKAAAFIELLSKNLQLQAQQLGTHAGEEEEEEIDPFHGVANPWRATPGPE